MLSIDEAIARERNLAEIYRNNIVPKEDYHNMPWIDMENESNMRIAKEHEQLAAWLEELKAIKDGSIPIIHGKAELELHDKVIRKEAIGDMVGNLIANSRTEIIDGKLMLIVTEERIKTVANEMKKQLDQLN